MPLEFVTRALVLLFDVCLYIFFYRVDLLKGGLSEEAKLLKKERLKEAEYYLLFLGIFVS